MTRQRASGVRAAAFRSRALSLARPSRWVEVGAVGREETQLRALGLDLGTCSGVFVRGQIVEDDDVTPPERGREHVRGPGGEPLAGHRSVEHERRGHARQPERADEGGGVPMAVRHAHAQPLALGCAAMQACHLGARSGLVDEDQPPGIEVGLLGEPGTAALQDIRAILLGRVAGLFLRVIRRLRKKRHSVATARLMPSSASVARNSASVPSGAASYAAMMRAACTSVVRLRMSPPWRAGATLPAAR